MNKIILIPSITIIILLSLFISLVYGYKLNSNTRNETHFIKVILLLTFLLLIFNVFIYIKTKIYNNEKPYNLVV